MKFSIMALLVLSLTACGGNPSREEPNAVKTSGRVLEVKDSQKRIPPKYAPVAPTGNTAADAATNVLVYGRASFHRCDYSVKTNEGQLVTASNFPKPEEACTYKPNDCVTVWIAPAARFQSIDEGGACAQ